MALRNFVASDGTRWSVWRVESGRLGIAAGAPRGWLAFVDERATERRRLFDIPPDWEALSAEQLDELREEAEPAESRGPIVLPTGVEFHAAPTTPEPTSRRFRDRAGVEWQVRGGHPTPAERRAIGEQRRVSPPPTLRRKGLRAGGVPLSGGTQRRRGPP